jgi:PKD repeat protein
MSRRWSVLAALIALLAGASAGLGQNGTPPVIEFISFPSTIAADGKDVRGLVGFKDADGDVAKASFDVVKAADYKSFSMDLKLEGQKEGTFEFALASAIVQDVTLRVALTDRAGNKSSSKEFSFSAQREIALLPELQIMINKAPTSATPGQTFNVEYTVRNGGNSGAGRFRTGAYLARGSSVTADDILIGSRDLGFLSEGVSFNFTLEVTIPADIFAKPGFRPGSVSLVLFVDDTQQVAESNENNNQAKVSLSVRNPGQAPEPPRAEFKAEPTRGPAPLSVQFVDQSSGEVASVFWDFGDGTTSADSNPTYVYRTPGSYTVKLIARGPAGEDTATKSNFIIVEQAPRVPPRADFSASPTSGTAPLTVQFTNRTTGEATSFFWEFGDGGTSTNANPIYVYRTAGTFTVKLTARGSGGEHSEIKSGFITVNPVAPPAQPPRADFTASPTSGAAPLTVQFTHRTTGQFTSLLWEFGDGSTSTLTSPTYIYRTAGTYTVKLTARGPGGENTATKSGFITVTSSTPPSTSPPRADFSANPTSGEAPLTVQFTNRTAGQFTTLAWEFGDGGTSTNVNPIYVYRTAGTYTVKLTARGPGGDHTETKTSYITVTTPSGPPPAQAPQPDFVASPTTGPAPLSVRFANRTTGDFTSLLWDFGDGQASVESNPSHIYISAGRYTVRLTARGPGGGNTETKADYIIVTSGGPSVPAPRADFSANPTIGSAPLTVQFTSRGAGEINSYSWEFGDDANSTSTSQNPTFTYRIAGLYTVKLTVRGPGGQSTETKANFINVTGPSAPPTIAPPQADFSATPTNGAAPLTVQFTNRTAGQFTTLAWEFGDGGTSTNANPIYVYRTAGTYTVKLTARGPGGEDSEAKPDYVTVTAAPVVQPPIADFTANPTSGTAPLTVQFTNRTTGQVTRYLWEFGDGASSTLTNPIYTYRTAGTYTVKLTATGPGGSGTETKTGLIKVSSAPVVQPPVADFSASPTNGTAPLTVQFANRTIGQVTRYLWEFGDGATSATTSPAYVYRAAGTYTVKLTATGPGGQDSETKFGLITVTSAPLASPPNADFTATPTSGQAPLTVQFTNRTTGQATSYVWEFGDGVSSTLSNPIYIYRNAGTYTVKLTAVGPGGQDTEAKASFITVTSASSTQAPKADFSALPTSGAAPLTVQFFNRTTGSFTGLLWEFGEGITSASTNPVVMYRNPGSYTVKLTARGPGGTSTETKTNYITVSGSGGNLPSTGSRNGLLAYYKFNEGSGGTAIDSAGNNNNGIIRGPAYVPGWESFGLRFNSSLDYIEIPNQNSFKSLTKFTMEAWINPSGAKSDRGIGSIIMTKGDVWNLALLDFGGGAYLKASVVGLSPTVVRGLSDPVEYGIFTHVAVTYDGATLRLFKNGKEIVTQAVTGKLSSDDLPLVIGASSPSPSINTGFEGTIDEVKVWNRALSAAELGKQVAAPQATAIYANWLDNPSVFPPGDTNWLTIVTVALEKERAIPWARRWRSLTRRSFYLSTGS